jgi:hypothetical protein
MTSLVVGIEKLTLDVLEVVASELLAVIVIDAS